MEKSIQGLAPLSHVAVSVSFLDLLEKSFYLLILLRSRLVRSWIFCVILYVITRVL